MMTRRWRWRAVALVASVLLAVQVFLGAAGAIAAPVRASAGPAGPIPVASMAAADTGGDQPQEQRRLPDAGFDGILVAAIGAGLTGAGWLLMLTGSRRLRRRSRSLLRTPASGPPDSLRQ